MKHKLTSLITDIFFGLCFFGIIVVAMTKFFPDDYQLLVTIIIIVMSVWVGVVVMSYKKHR